MRIGTIGEIQQPITCDGCDHSIVTDQQVLTDTPEQVPEDFQREAFRHFHIRCQECEANSITCYQLYASRQVSFAAQTNTNCDRCGHTIHAGQDMLRDFVFIWNVTGDAVDDGVASGGLAGIGRAHKSVAPTPFKALPYWFKEKFRTAGLRPGQGYRTPAETQQLYLRTVPRSVRNTGLPAIEEFLHGKDLSHKTPVVNAPDKAKIPGNTLWERRHWNRSRGPANMKPWEKVRAHTMNGADTARIVGKNALVNARRATIWGVALEAPVSATEAAIRVAKGKMSKKDAAKKAATNTAKAGMAAGAIGGGVAVVAALGAGPILSVASPVLIPGGVAIYGVSSFQRIKAAMHDSNPLPRVPFYFHVACSDCGTGLNCFEAFAAELSTGCA